MQTIDVFSSMGPLVVGLAVLGVGVAATLILVLALMKLFHRSRENGDQSQLVSEIHSGFLRLEERMSALEGSLAGEQEDESDLAAN